jgi:hypothetical protein
MWSLVAWLCAAYVFFGLAVFGFALNAGSWILIGLVVVVYLLNLALLRHARKQPW